MKRKKKPPSGGFFLVDPAIRLQVVSQLQPRPHLIRFMRCSASCKALKRR
jgi:hypothetical protein